LLAETAGPETSERWRPGHRRESLGKKNRFVTLTITIHGARNLLAKDSNGLSDPYALITFGKMEYKTRVIQCTLNPVWEETRTFTLYQVESAHPNVIHVLLFDDDTIQHTPLTRSSNRADVGDDDFLGHVEIELPVVGGSSRAWYLLRQRSHRSHVAGEVEISIALTSVELDYNRLAKPRPGTGTVIDTRAFHSASQQRAREARPRPWPLPGDVDAGVVASCLVQAQLGTDVVWPWYKLVMYDEYAVLRIDDSTPPSFLVVLALVLVDGVRQLDGGFLSLPIHGMRSRGGSLKLRFASDAVASEWAERFQSARPLHRYGSRYAPAACPAEDVALFGCGSEYFASLVDAVVGAQRFICIADWYLSPEVYLKRDVLPLDARYRLDNLLRSKAEQGVQVFVLCFDDHNMIGLASERVVKTFNLLHRNVHCMRHGPTEIKDAYFSHHQKFVIVECVLFLGVLFCVTHTCSLTHAHVRPAHTAERRALWAALIFALDATTSPTTPSSTPRFPLCGLERTITTRARWRTTSSTGPLSSAPTARASRACRGRTPMPSSRARWRTRSRSCSCSAGRTTASSSTPRRASACLCLCRRPRPVC